MLAGAKRQLLQRGSVEGAVRLHQLDLDADSPRALSVTLGPFHNLHRPQFPRGSDGKEPGL